MSFELNSLKEAKKVADSTKIFKLVVNIGDSKIYNYTSSKHETSTVSKKELIDAGSS